MAESRDQAWRPCEESAAGSDVTAGPIAVVDWLPSLYAPLSSPASGPRCSGAQHEK
ncbi:MAG: hypothetical protein LQ338_007067 [Usnochroma carphineum]|nr:MAG: hypothetical protein LQ338_007067 [Usnochroma carphineum]